MIDPIYNRKFGTFSSVISKIANVNAHEYQTTTQDSMNIRPHKPQIDFNGR